MSIILTYKLLINGITHERVCVDLAIKDGAVLILNLGDPEDPGVLLLDVFSRVARISYESPEEMISNGSADLYLILLSSFRIFKITNLFPRLKTLHLRKAMSPNFVTIFCGKSVTK